MTVHHLPLPPLAASTRWSRPGSSRPSGARRWQAVAERYAVSVTPAMAGLIDPSDPPIRSRASSSPIRRNSSRCRRRSPIRSATRRIRRSRAWSIAIPTAPCSSSSMPARSIAASASGARWSGPAATALTGERLDAALAYLAAPAEIWEVIMTGGDPFILSARRVREVAQAPRRDSRISRSRAGIRVCRWSTPARITADYAKALRIPGKASYIAVHANHPREFTPAACAALARLVDAGHVLISQSVLLKGVNADVETLSRPDARLRREPREALLPAPSRISRRARRISGSRWRRGRPSSKACEAIFRACASRPISSTSPAGPERSPSVPLSSRRCETPGRRGVCRGPPWRPRIAIRRPDIRSQRTREGQAHAREDCRSRSSPTSSAPGASSARPGSRRRSPVMA